MKFQANRDNRTYIEKHDFQQKLVCQIKDRHWIHCVETSPRVVLNSNSESQLALHAKRNKSFNCQFHRLSRKMWLFCKRLQIEILDTVGKYFSILIRDPQNKALFVSNQLTKFVIFARKSVLIIQTLSSRMEGIIVMRRPRETSWNPVWLSKLAKEQWSTMGSHDLPTCGPQPPIVAIPSCLLPFRCFLTPMVWCVWRHGGRSREMVEGLWWSRREKKKSREREREREQQGERLGKKGRTTRGSEENDHRSSIAKDGCELQRRRA